MSKIEEKMTLSELIVYLKKEIRNALEEGDKNPMFKFAGATIKTRITAVREDTVKGGIKLYVVNSDIAESEKQSFDHEIIVELKSIRDDIFMGEN